MVEQLTLNQLVPGSSPGGATKFPFFPSHFLILRTVPRRRSSMVEHLFCKQAVAGSNPIAGSIGFNVSAAIAPADSSVRCKNKLFTARLCNGSTNDSDSFCLGSTPSRAANKFCVQKTLQLFLIVSLVRTRMCIDRSN